MDIERIHQLANERIAANGEWAVRELVRTNARLADEVHYLRAIVYGQDPDHPCEGCLRWSNSGSRTHYCKDATAPEPWYTSAVDGGEPGCPNYVTHQMRNPIVATIQIELLKFKDGIGHIDRSLTEGYVTEEQAHRQKNKLAAIYAGHIARLVEREVTG